MEGRSRLAGLSSNLGPARNRRGPIACKRCRRLRSRCNHAGSPPCTSCSGAGSMISAECVFPQRGEKDVNRDFRAKRHNTVEKTVKSSSEDYTNNKDYVDVDATLASSDRSLFPTAKGHDPDTLPPHDEVVEGCRVFITSYFQLGFIPKAVFLERLSNDSKSPSVFLLLTILGVSARFTPSLLKRYGNEIQATTHFLDCAARMVPAEMYAPTLERTQAFFLLSISEWGNSYKDRSFIHMGIAVRMASILRLHREETYRLPDTATSEEIVEAEMARRTFWMIQSQDNLHSGYTIPVSFSPSDITALLPSDERDFAFGTVPHTRATLQSTPPALANPESVFTPARSLFATLIQAHQLWGTVARRACRSEDSVAGLTTTPWEAASEYMQLSSQLRDWEDGLPKRHRWSVWNLRGYKAESQDLAYLAVVMVNRLTNIVLRRIFLDDLLSASHLRSLPEECSQTDFWRTMSQDLFTNVVELHEQIEAYFPLRSREQGYPAILVFCVYVCGSLASYLWKYPQLCLDLASRAEEMAMRSLTVLEDLQHAWPTALRWSIGLKQVATPSSEQSSSPVLSAKHAGISHKVLAEVIFDGPSPIHPGSGSSISQGALAFNECQPYDLTGAGRSPLTLNQGVFEADFDAFLKGDMDYGFLDGWQLQAGL